MNQAKPIPAELLRRVKRTARDSQGRPRERSIHADEVQDWREHGDRVVVVTTDGRRWTARLPGGDSDPGEAS